MSVLKLLSQPVWNRHRLEFAKLRERQALDRQTERDRHAEARKGISFAMAKAAILQELDAVPPTPRRLKVPQPSRPLGRSDERAPKNDIDIIIARGEQIRRDMEGWRRRYPGRDQGQEM
ncbi:hypothetical protein J4G48_0006475 [Bradyrhizobium barranii subsp. apii]|uniref:hypothetical protein n=1 Tax=Bradyrhizobium barranii TaxID=2992140 RepID=UPI001AA1051C|nr:hypothetical protein [Bradyrhizobium barranii]UPT97738.1 hypothetical protein J4G48_0006475 [Bradyrhizobium barranii subsp. apii]